MHFNENFGRALAITKSGNEWIRIVFPKQKQGEHTPKIVPVPQTFSKIYNIYSNMFDLHASVSLDYAKELVRKAIDICTHEEQKPSLPDNPRSLASAYERPNKDTIPLFSRYNH